MSKKSADAKSIAELKRQAKQRQQDIENRAKERLDKAHAELVKSAKELQQAERQLMAMTISQNKAVTAASKMFKKGGSRRRSRGRSAY